MERSFFFVLTLGAIFASSVATAQQRDPTLPEDADEEQTMVPEDAEDDVTPGEDADDTRASRQAAAPAPQGNAPAARTPAQTPAATPATPATTPATPAPAASVSAAPAVAAPARLIVVPSSRSSERLDEGCWARLYGASQAAGDSVTIVGPIDMPMLRGPFGLEWDDRIGNVEAGPRATVSLFADEEYEDLSTTVAPGRRLASAGGEYESLRIACSAQATG
jgi:hypothetical protein